MQTIANGPGNWAYVIGPYREPVATVQPGETFAVETDDAFENRIDSPDADITKLIVLPFVNPLAGPIYVEGAEKGDTLAVTIHSIDVTRDYGVSNSMSGRPSAASSRIPSRWRRWGSGTSGGVGLSTVSGNSVCQMRLEM